MTPTEMRHFVQARLSIHSTQMCKRNIYFYDILFLVFYIMSMCADPDAILRSLQCLMELRYLPESAVP